MALDYTRKVHIEAEKQNSMRFKQIIPTVIIIAL